MYKLNNGNYTTLPPPPPFQLYRVHVIRDLNKFKRWKRSFKFSRASTISRYMRGNMSRQKRLFSVSTFTPQEGTLHVDEPGSRVRLRSRVSLCGFATQFHTRLRNRRVENCKITRTRVNACIIIGIAD